MFRDLELSKVYDSDKDDLINDFYVPALSDSILYKRITGYFSSGSLSLASAGILSLIKNNGKMMLVTGVDVSDEDYDALKSGVENDFLSDYFEKEILSSSGGELDHLKLLSWMIAKDRLEIKIAVMPETARGVFHPKVGVMYDKNGDKIAFSGSVNETAGGWLNNHEEFKVFRSWNFEENSYLEKDELKFDKYWNSDVDKFSVISLPKALKDEFLKIRPSDQEFNEIEKRVLADYSQKKTVVESTSSDAKNLDYPIDVNKKKALYDYQEIAVENWVNNGYRGILEMATGTGKTLTSLGAIERAFNDKDRLFVIIGAPQGHLIEQWREIVLDQLPDVSVDVCDGDNKNWRHDLDSKLFDYKNKIIDRAIILTTYTTLSSDDFISLFKSKYDNSQDYLFVADEMHNSGATRNSRCLLEEFNLRLGLSATPERYFDDDGTEKIYKYFGDTVYEYSLKRAIDEGKLTHYEYHPILINMTNEEYEEYLKITRQMITLANKSDDQSMERLDRLMMKRAEITKKTEAKYHEFNEVIKELVQNKKDDYLLIYCQDSEQLTECQKTINSFGIINHKLTEKENNKVRKELLREFSNGGYKALVAMNCLDEGIDVPATKTAIIMASTGNPRQYVQRRGRVLRKSEGKEMAYIYDFIVIPPKDLPLSLISKAERSIIKRELKRVGDFLETADNKLEIINYLSDTMSDYGVYI
jgi:superfamily II DNA or RNA helicase